MTVKLPLKLKKDGDSIELQKSKTPDNTIDEQTGQQKETEAFKLNCFSVQNDGVIKARLISLSTSGGSPLDSAITTGADNYACAEKVIGPL